MTSPDSPEKTSPGGSVLIGSDGTPLVPTPSPESKESEHFRALCGHLSVILGRVQPSVIRSWQKKSDRQATAFIFMHYASILGESGITLNEPGNEFTVSLEVGNLMPKEGQSTT